MLLFVDRARLQQSAFALTAENADAIARICTQLDGLPLAIELAAAWVDVLSVEQITARLEDRFRFLMGRQHSGAARHQTLQSAIDWSYDLLNDEEQALFRHLAAFTGSFDLDGAEAIGNRGQGTGDREQQERGEDSVLSPQSSVLIQLRRLMEASLVVLHENSGTGRYRTLETLRAYGRERLQTAGEEEAAFRRHAEYYLTLMTTLEPSLTGSAQGAGLDRLQRELDNLRAALRWLEEQGEIEAALRLAVVLWRFWQVRGSLSEGRNWLERLLARAATSNVLRARALYAAGDLTWRQSDAAAAQARYEEHLALCRDLGDRRGAASALFGLGIVAHVRGKFDEARSAYEACLAERREVIAQEILPADAQQRLDDLRNINTTLNNLALVTSRQGEYETARAHFEESLLLAREIDNEQLIGTAFANLGLLALDQGDLPTAHRRSEAAIACFERVGDSRNCAAALNNLAQVLRAQGDLEGARTRAAAALARYREHGVPGGIASALTNLALTAHDEGDHAQAELLIAEALASRLEIGNPMELAESLEAAVELALGRGDHTQAIRLFGAASALRESENSPASPFQRSRLDDLLSRVPDALGNQAYATLLSEGREMTPEQAVACAGEVPAPQPQRRTEGRGLRTED